MVRAREIAVEDVLDVVRVYGDNKISLVKEVRQALGGIKPGDKLVIMKMEDGCFIKKGHTKTQPLLSGKDM